MDTYGQTSGGLALLFTVGALGAFLIEMVLASHGIRDLAAKVDEIDEWRNPSILKAGKAKLDRPVGTQALIRAHLTDFGPQPRGRPFARSGVKSGWRPHPELKPTKRRCGRSVH